MKEKKKEILILFCVVVLSFIGFRLIENLIAGEDFELLNARIDRLETQVGSLVNRGYGAYGSRHAEVKVDASKEGVESGLGWETVEEFSASTEVGEPGNRRKRTRATPEYEELFAEKKRQVVGKQYGSLFRALELEGRDRERLENLLVEARMIPLLYDNALEGEERLGKAEKRAVVETMVEDIRTEIAEVLGPERYESFNRYEQTLSSRMTLEPVVAPLFRGEDALSDTQFDSLVAAFHEATIANRNGLLGGLSMSSDSKIDRFRMTLDGVEAVLSDEQLVALGEVFAQEEGRLKKEDAFFGIP